MTSATDSTGTWGGYHDPLPVGGIAVALMMGTSALMHVGPSYSLLVAGFCGTALVYGADRGGTASPEDVWNHPERRAWVRRHRSWLVAEGIVLGLAGIVAFIGLSWTTIAVAIGLAGAGGLHLVSSTRSGYPLKTLGLGKPLLIATVWAVGGTVLPVLEAGVPLSGSVVALTGYRLLFILPNVLLSDWGDRAGDAAAGLDPWTEWGTERGLRWTAAIMLGGAVAGGVGAGIWSGRPVLFGIDACGPLLMIGAVWTVDPRLPAHRFLLDALVAWPLVTALAAWGMG